MNILKDGSELLAFSSESQNLLMWAALQYTVHFALFLKVRFQLFLVISVPDSVSLTSLQMEVADKNRLIFTNYAI